MGFTEARGRVLLSVMLGIHESHQDSPESGRDLIARTRPAPPPLASRWANRGSRRRRHRLLPQPGGFEGVGAAAKGATPDE